MLTRRTFLTSVGAAVGLVAAEPVRRYWQVGASLSAPRPYFTTPTPFDQERANAAPGV